MGLFDGFRAALRAKEFATATELERLVVEASATYERARAELERLHGLDHEMLIASDAERAKHRSALTAADQDAHDAALYVSALRTQHGHAVAREDAAERMGDVVAARAKSDAAATWIRTKYPKLAADIRAGLRMIAEAQLAVEDVNARVPDGAELVAGPEDFRHFHGQPREETKRTTVELWCREGSGEPLPDVYQSQVKASGGGVGLRSATAGGLQESQRCTKRTFTRVENRARVAPVWADPLARGVSLPGVGATDEPFALADDVSAVELLQRLSGKPESGAAPEREIEVELIPVAMAEAA